MSKATSGWVVVVVVAATACGGADTTTSPDAMQDLPDHAETSGTRLKLRWASFDGAKVSAGLTDSQRGGELCTPGKLSDGKMYCIPEAGSVVYRDAACTAPIGRQLATCPQSEMQYFLDIDLTECAPAGRRLFRRGPALAGPVGFYVASAAGCTGPIDGGRDQFFELGAEVPAMALAGMDTAVDGAAEASPGRLHQRYATSADGARVFAGIHDSELDADCRLTLDASRSTARCLPESSSMGWYGDAACASPRASYRKGCPPPAYAASSERSCQFVPSVPKLYRRGAPTAAALFLPTVPGDSSPLRCSMADGNPALSYYEVGERIGLEAMPRGPAPQGAGRYRFMYTRQGGGGVRDAALYDTAKQVECIPTAMPDGALRCLPHTPYPTQLLYRDPACTIEQAVMLVPNAPAPGCSLPELPSYVQRTLNSDACVVSYEVRKVADVYVGPLYYRAGKGCEPRSTFDTTVYALGSVEDLDDWPAVRPTVDP